MKEYAVCYKEILSKTIIVKAQSVAGAIRKTREAGISGEIVLDYDDYDDTEVTVSQYANSDGTATENQLKMCWHLN
jgi:hypothetical protein